MLSTLLLLGSAAAPALSGSWVANGARLKLRQEGATVIGTLAAAASGSCPLPEGAEVLRGTLLDDSLAAQVRLCLLAPSCAGESGSALAVLLVTTQLTGGVSTPAACASNVRALTLRKPGAEAPLTLELPAINERLSKTPAPRKPAPGAAARDPRRISEHARPEAGPASAAPVRTDSDDPDALLARAFAELQAGRYEPARKLFRETLRREPARAEAANGVGVTFYARGDYDEALAWYKRALETDPRYGDAYYNLACLYALQGHRELALRYLRLAALNRYSEPEQLLTDPDLASLQREPELREIVDQMSVALKPSHAARAPSPAEARP